jgi:hypothetical protein
LQAYDKKRNEKKKKKKKKIKVKGEHLGTATGSVLILIKFVCFVVNVVSVLINVFIIVKIKCVNSSRISDICSKVNFTINCIYFITLDIHLIKTHTNITIFKIFGGTVPQQDLRISLKVSPRKLKKIF